MATPFSLPRLSRRKLLLATGALASTPLTAAPKRFGILGQPAPPLAVEHWIDGDGLPMRFDPRLILYKWVFLECFQSDCPGCHSRGFPALKTIADAFAEEPRVAVLGVQTAFENFAVNTADQLPKLQRRYGLHIPMGHDPGPPMGDTRPLTMRQFRTGGTPWIIVIDPNGYVVFNDYHINAAVFIQLLRKRLA